MQPLPQLRFPSGWNAETTHAHIRSAVARDGLMHFRAFPAHDRTLVIVGNGPSMTSQISAIRRRKRAGAAIVATQSSDGALIAAGIVPDFVAIMDGASNLHELITPHPDVTYLVASMCHPSVFERLAGRHVVLWHAENGHAEQNLLMECASHIPWVLIGGGSTIGMRCVNLGYLLGFRKFHTYGIDSNLKDGVLHAIREPGDEKLIAKAFEIECAGRKFTVTPQFAQQAQDFVNLMRTTFAGRISVIAHGDGLIPHICRAMRRNGECQRKLNVV
jgi:hypothetical protein